MLEMAVAGAGAGGRLWLKQYQQFMPFKATESPHFHALFDGFVHRTVVQTFLGGKNNLLALHALAYTFLDPNPAEEISKITSIDSKGVGFLAAALADLYPKEEATNFSLAWYYAQNLNAEDALLYYLVFGLFTTPPPPPTYKVKLPTDKPYVAVRNNKLLQQDDKPNRKNRNIRYLSRQRFKKNLEDEQYAYVWTKDCCLMQGSPKDVKFVELDEENMEQDLSALIESEDKIKEGRPQIEPSSIKPYNKHPFSAILEVLQPIVAARCGRNAMVGPAVMQYVSNLNPFTDRRFAPSRIATLAGWGFLVYGAQQEETKTKFWFDIAQVLVLAGTELAMCGERVASVRVVHLFTMMTLYQAMLNYQALAQRRQIILDSLTDGLKQCMGYTETKEDKREYLQIPVYEDGVDYASSDFSSSFHYPYNGITLEEEYLNISKYLPKSADFNDLILTASDDRLFTPKTKGALIQNAFKYGSTHLYLPKVDGDTGMVICGELIPRTSITLSDFLNKFQALVPKLHWTLDWTQTIIYTGHSCAVVTLVGALVYWHKREKYQDPDTIVQNFVTKKVDLPLMAIHAVLLTFVTLMDTDQLDLEEHTQDVLNSFEIKDVTWATAAASIPFIVWQLNNYKPLLDLLITTWSGFTR